MQGVVKAYVISFAVGLIVGAFYAAIRVKSPAPPIIALAGLLGMVLGELAWPKASAAVGILFRHAP